MVQKTIQAPNNTVSTISSDHHYNVTKTARPEGLTEINEISNSSAYQDFYDIDFETSGIALDIAETKEANLSTVRERTPISRHQTSCSPVAWQAVDEIGRM